MFDPMLVTDSSSDDDNRGIEGVRRRQRRRKQYRSRISYNWLEDTAFEFNERFRISKTKFENLQALVSPSLIQDRRGGALSVQKLMEVVLHWLGSGVQYHALGDMHGISKATVCRCVQKFVKTVNRHLYPRTVRFPTDMNTVAQEFYALAQMPRVCGAVDGTLIKIDVPTANEPDFVDRHGNHSINCMAVCGPNMQFYAIDAHWPGSVHDSRVLKNSNLWQDFEDNRFPLQDGIILGDSAYMLRKWLITPVIRPAATPEERVSQERFLRSHKLTRRVIECAFGILKEKFMCLYHLHVNPIFAAKIFKCCAALCNFARDGNNNEEDFARLRELMLQDNEEVYVDQNGNDEDDHNARRDAEQRLRQLYNHFL